MFNLYSLVFKLYSLVFNLCNYQGSKGGSSSPGVFRYRHLPMGVSGSPPSYQHQWASAIKWVVNERVLVPMCRQHLEHNGLEWEVVDEMSVSSLAAMYVDDGKTRHPACYTLQQAEQQFAAVPEFLGRHGIQYSAKKTVWSNEQGDYVGVGLDTVRCEASVQPGRADKYHTAIEELLDEDDSAGVVGRASLASTVGKLQFTADVR